jgi:hypothetical protein
MANTDKTEWRLRDTNLTTDLGIIPASQSHLYFEIDEPGSGELRLPLNTTKAGQIASGMFAECFYRGASRGGMFIENIKETEADAGEYGGRWMSVSGRGPLALLEDAIVWDDGTTSTAREFTSVTKASILITLITEAKARGGLANLTYDFSASVDTASVSWTDSEHYKLPVGTSLLDVARQFAKTGGFDFEINLSGANFVLSAYAAGSGADLSETIYMRTGTNCEEVSSDERGDGINNALRVKYKAGYLTVSDSTSITNRRRREKLLSLEQAQTSASATTYASAKIAQTKDPKNSIAVRVYDGVSPRLFVDYDMGDYIMLDVLGTETRYRVLGIQADFDGVDFSHVVLELNTILYDKEMEMSQDLDWLLDQWNTAKDANELETSFWAALGVRSGTINDMLIYNGYLYICGLGNMGAGGYPGVARYEIATGIWSAMGTTFASTDECTALVQMGGSIFVSAVKTSPTNIVYQWNGTSWDEYFYASGQTGARILQMIADGSSQIIFCGTGFTDTAPPVYRYVSGTNLIGTDRYALTFLASAGTCRTVAFYGSVLHAGWDSSSGYNGFMKTIALSPTRDGCDKEFSPIVISELNNRYATKLLEFGSDLLVAYRDSATGVAYLGSWNGTTFTLLGTFTNAGNDAIINSITTYLTDIYVGGNFTSVGGTAMNRVAKYSGGVWSPLTNGVGTNNVLASAYNDLDFYVAGTFDNVDGTLKPADGLGIYFTDFQKALDFAALSNSVRWGDIGGTLSDQTDLQAALDAKIAGVGVVGRVAEFVTNTKTIQAAKIIGPAANIITILNPGAAKSITFPGSSNDTVAMLATANVFTQLQTVTPSTPGNSITATGEVTINTGANAEPGLTIVGNGFFQTGKLFTINDNYWGDRFTIDKLGQVVISLNPGTTTTRGLQVVSNGGGATETNALQFVVTEYGAGTYVIGFKGLSGVYAYLANASGNQVYAGSVGIEIIAEATKTASITDAVGLYISAIAVSGAGTKTVTNSKGIHILNQGNAVVTNTYGLLLDDQSGSATLNYAIYTKAGLVHFGDSVDLASGKNITLIAGNIITDTTTGTKIGTATGQKLAFHNSTPVIQRAGAAQALVATTASTNVVPYGFTTSAQADAIVTLVNEIRDALVEKGIIKGSA